MDTFDTSLSRAIRVAALSARPQLVFIHPSNGHWSVMSADDARKEGIPITYWRAIVQRTGEVKLY